MNTKELAKKLKISYGNMLRIIKEQKLKPSYILGKTKVWDYEDVKEQLKEAQND